MRTEESELFMGESKMTMTDNEIIKALEDNVNGLFYCEITDEEILDLINRQKAEIGRLRKALEVEATDNMLVNSENDALKAELVRVTTEAYKEFAERLKCGVPQETGVIRCKDVDFTLTKLTERREDEGK